MGSLSDRGVNSPDCYPKPAHTSCQLGYWERDGGCCFGSVTGRLRVGFSILPLRVGWYHHCHPLRLAAIKGSITTAIEALRTDAHIRVRIFGDCSLWTSVCVPWCRVDGQLDVSHPLHFGYDEFVVSNRPTHNTRTHTRTYTHTRTHTHAHTRTHTHAHADLALTHVHTSTR